MTDEVILSYEISKAYTEKEIRDCYVNQETNPARPPKYIYAFVYPPFPYRITSGSIQTNDLKLVDADRTQNDPLAVWKLLQQIGAVPPNKKPGKETDEDNAI